MNPAANGDDTSFVSVNSRAARKCFKNELKGGTLVPDFSALLLYRLQPLSVAHLRYRWIAQVSPAGPFRSVFNRYVNSFFFLLSLS